MRWRQNQHSLAVRDQIDYWNSLWKTLHDCQRPKLKPKGRKGCTCLQSDAEEADEVKCHAFPGMLFVFRDLLVTSTDRMFLSRHWNGAKEATEFMLSSPDVSLVYCCLKYSKYNFVLRTHKHSPSCRCRGAICGRRNGWKQGVSFLRPPRR